MTEVLVKFAPSKARAENEKKQAEAEANGNAVPEVDPELDEFIKLQSMSAGQIAEKVAEAAVQEAEHKMMVAEAKGEMEGISNEARTAENTLRHVQMEEVEDEDL